MAHEALITAAMLQRTLEGPVLGVAYESGDVERDGDRYGAEFVIACGSRFQRVATFRAIELPPVTDDERWSVLLAVLDDAFDGEPPFHAIRALDGVSSESVATARERRHGRSVSPVTHAVGAYLDAIDVLAPGARSDTRQAGGGDDNYDTNYRHRGGYGYAVDTGTAPWEIDLRPAIRDAVFDLAGGEPAECVALHFEDTIAIATDDVIRAIAFKYGRLPIILTGSCFEKPALKAALARCADFRRSPMAGLLGI